ncbi:MAG: two-component regulator propeller domain-containing protein [Candidatus Latescibacterota bacterium]|nr:two-component regulator propeller domain-containing protein [Candidatus Latescibacterota bacterium]
MQPVHGLVARATGVWAATDGGVLHFDPETSTFNRLTRLDGLTAGRITAVAVDPSGDLWFGSHTGGISRYRDATGRFSPPLWTFAGLSVRALLALEGRLYVGSNLGISVLRTDVLRVRENYWQMGAFPRNTGVTDLIEHRGRLFVGTDEGIAWADLTAPNLQDPSAWSTTQETGAIVGMVVASDTLLALGADGLWRWHKDGWVRETSPVGLRVIGGGGEGILAASDQAIFRRRGTGTWFQIAHTKAAPRVVAQGPQRIWIGSDHGIDAVGGTRLPDPGDPPSTNFYDLAVGPSSDLWVTVVPNDREGTPIGIAQLSNSKWRIHERGDGLPSNLAVAVAVTEDGSVWAGTWGSGVGVRSVDGHWQRLDQTNSVLRGITQPFAPGFVVVSDLIVDAEGLVWALNVQAGVAVFDPLSGASQLHELEDLGLPPGRHLIEIAADGAGLLLIATPLDGVVLFDDGGTPFAAGDEFSQLLSTKTEARLTTDAINTVAATGEVLYIGTSEGLFRARYNYDRSAQKFQIVNWRPYGPEHGLRSPVITDIEVDSQGMVWIGTAEGLTQLEESGRLVATYTADNSGLVDDHILALRFDKVTGNLWIGTSGGLGRLRVASGTIDFEERVTVFPNPFLPGAQHERVAFAGLPPGTEVRLYTADGSLVRRLETTMDGVALWDGTNESGAAVASGLYFFTGVTTGMGQVVRGKLAVIWRD